MDTKTITCPLCDWSARNEVDGDAEAAVLIDHHLRLAFVDHIRRAHNTEAWRPPPQDCGIGWGIWDPAPAAAPDVTAVAWAFVQHYTREGGCGHCGGTPHTVNCFVGRFLAVLGP